jgi:hypothetical protein
MTKKNESDIALEKVALDLSNSSGFTMKPIPVNKTNLRKMQKMLDIQEANRTTGLMSVDAVVKYLSHPDRPRGPLQTGYILELHAVPLSKIDKRTVMLVQYIGQTNRKGLTGIYAWSILKFDSKAECVATHSCNDICFLKSKERIALEAEHEAASLDDAIKYSKKYWQDRLHGDKTLPNLNISRVPHEDLVRVADIIEMITATGAPISGYLEWYLAEYKEHVAAYSILFERLRGKGIGGW